MVLFGADRVAEFENLFTGRVALLTGPSGRTSGNVPTIDVLKQCCNLQLLLAPEHGVRGDKAAGALFADELDEGSGLPSAAFIPRTPSGCPGRPWPFLTPWSTTLQTWAAGTTPF